MQKGLHFVVLPARFRELFTPKRINRLREASTTTAQGLLGKEFTVHAIV